MISRGFIYVLFFSLSWALDAVIAGYAFSEGSNVFVYCYQRTCISALFFFLYLKVASKDSPKRKLKSKNIPYLILLGVVGSGLGTYFGFEGIKYSTVNYGFLMKTTVVFAPILEFFIFRKVVTLKRVFFIGVLLVGAFLISTKGKLILPINGDIYSIVAAFCYAATNVFSISLLKKNSSEYTALFRTIGGGVFLFIIAYLSTEDLIQKEYLWLTLGGGIFSFFLFFFLYKALEVVSATYVAMVGMSFSVFTAILSYVVLGQKLIPIQWVGAVIILFSAVMIEIKGSPIKLMGFFNQLVKKNIKLGKCKK